MTATRTTCPYCGVGCGVLATPHADGTAEIAGDPDHPANKGRLCSKGAALGETLALDGRLLHPTIEGQRATWDAALDLVATKFRETIAAHGPDSVAFYVSGQLLTEDYYVANKLMKGFIGSANIDTNSRLCMASSVAGHKRAFGADTVPGCYDDLEQADLVVLVGSNLAWCHPVLYQRLAAARETRGTKVVVIDPRRTATCEIADVHLAIAPGSDVALFNGLLVHLDRAGAIDRDYVARHTSGIDAALDVAASLSLAGIARRTGLAEADISAFYALFASTERVVTAWSQGVNQSTAGTDKVNAIINCHLASGRIGRPGTGPFSITGQPNAMGGRETGGLANMLAAHMELGDADHRRIVQSFWRSPRIAEKPGLKAIELFRAVADGRVKAIWIMSTNPVDSLPEADAVRAALAACPFVVVSDIVPTDTTAHAHVLLPAAAWGEKNGTVTNSERRISRQRAFLAAPEDARPDWWQLAEVARRMGFADAFAYAGPHEIFAEYAALTGVENDGARDLDISACADLAVDAYAALAPFQWGKERFFADGRFFTPDRRARFVATPFRPPATVPIARYPLVLNTGRIRDQWHTMTRTARTPRLMSHSAEPFVELHPDDAAACGLAPAMIAEIESLHGRALARVVVTTTQRRGAVFSPMHWTDQLAADARINAVVNAVTDPVSGQPELKHTPVAVRPYPAAWHAFAVTTPRPALGLAPYAALAPVRGGWRLELAGTEPVPDWSDAARALLAPVTGDHAFDVLAYVDADRGQHRFAVCDGTRLVGALFVSREPVAVARTWLIAQLGQAITEAAPLRLLAGRPGGDVPDSGPIVCACFEVGRNQIAAIGRASCATVASVGARLKAGTNCGSCRAEIGRILDDVRRAHAI